MQNNSDSEETVYGVPAGRLSTAICVAKDAILPQPKPYGVRFVKGEVTYAAFHKHVLRGGISSGVPLLYDRQESYAPGLLGLVDTAAASLSSLRLKAATYGTSDCVSLTGFTAAVFGLTRNPKLFARLADLSLYLITVYGADEGYGTARARNLLRMIELAPRSSSFAALWRSLGEQVGKEGGGAADRVPDVKPLFDLIINEPTFSWGVRDREP